MLRAGGQETWPSALALSTQHSVLSTQSSALDIDQHLSRPQGSGIRRPQSRDRGSERKNEWGPRGRKSRMSDICILKTADWKLASANCQLPNSDPQTTSHEPRTMPLMYHALLSGLPHSEHHGYRQAFKQRANRHSKGNSGSAAVGCRDRVFCYLRARLAA